MENWDFQGSWGAGRNGLLGLREDDDDDDDKAQDVNQCSGSRVLQK